MSLGPPHLCAPKRLTGSPALQTFLFGVASPNVWSRQSAKAAVTDRQASPSDPAAVHETAAAVLRVSAESLTASNQIFPAPSIPSHVRVRSEIRENSKFTPERTL
jgi:hypothetical protein